MILISLIVLYSIPHEMQKLINKPKLVNNDLNRVRLILSFRDLEHTDRIHKPISHKHN